MILTLYRCTLQDIQEQRCQVNSITLCALRVTKMFKYFDFYTHGNSCYDKALQIHSINY